MYSETSTSTTVDNLNKPKKSPKLGLKPVLAAKPPVQVDEIREVASGNTSMSTSTNDLPKASLTPAAADMEVTRLEENAEPTDSGVLSVLTFEACAKDRFTFVATRHFNYILRNIAM